MMIMINREHESDSDTNLNRNAWSNDQRLSKGSERLRNRRIQKKVLLRSAIILRRILES